MSCVSSHSNQYMIAPTNYKYLEILTFSIPPNQNKNSNLKDLTVCTELAFTHSLFIYLITVLQVPYFVLYLQY